MRVLQVIAVALLCTSVEASTASGTYTDCSAVWNDDKLQQTSGALRLTVIHQQHPCSPVRRHQPDPLLSWQRELGARLFFRRRRRAPATNISAQVTASFHGFLTQVAVGTPPRRQSMLIDSAAALSWIQCEPCRVGGTTGSASSAGSCFDQDDPVFDPSASATYRKVPCSSPLCVSFDGNASGPGLCAVQEDRCIYYMPYLDSSLSTGRVGTDTLTFGDEALPAFVFGCSQHYRGVFGMYAGILGFATGKESFFSQVVERSRKYRAFSFYLPSPTSIGYIQVGAYNEDGLAFTPMFANGSDYYIALTGITVDGCPLDLIGSGFSPGTMATPCYVDLGTPLSMLPRQAYQKLRDAVAERIRGYDRIKSTPGCFEPAYLSSERAIPVVQLQFSNAVSLVLDEHKLMSEYVDEVLCLGLVPGPYFLLGACR